MVGTGTPVPRVARVFFWKLQKGGLCRGSRGSRGCGAAEL